MAIIRFLLIAGLFIWFVPSLIDFLVNSLTDDTKKPTEGPAGYLANRTTLELFIDFLPIFGILIAFSIIVTAGIMWLRWVFIKINEGE